MLRKPWIKKKFWIDYTGLGEGRENKTLLKSRVILIVLTLLNLNDNQISLSSTSVREMGLN
jgi:hypothetical protein